MTTRIEALDFRCVVLVGAAVNRVKREKECARGIGG